MHDLRAQSDPTIVVRISHTESLLDSIASHGCRWSVSVDRANAAGGQWSLAERRDDDGRRGLDNNPALTRQEA
jgi:hypothetical protein